MTEQTDCRDGKCICMFEMSPILNPDKTYSCVGKYILQMRVREFGLCEMERKECVVFSCFFLLIFKHLRTAVKDMPPEKLQYVDPTMIFILVVMALMFIIICIVLRLFAR